MICSTDPVEWLKHVESEPLSDRDLPESSYALLCGAAAKFPDRDAVHHLPRGLIPGAHSWTYRRLLHNVHQGANLFYELGVEPNGVIATLLPNGPATFQAILGAQLIGVINPVNPALRAEHIADIAELTGARVLLCPAPQSDIDLWGKANEVACRMPGLRLVTVGGPAGFEEMASRQPGDRPRFDHRPQPDDVAAYFHTGGTTGIPKVAVHTHANQIYTSWAIALALGFDQDSVLLSGLPLFHVNALHVATLAPMFAGGASVSLGPDGYRDPAAIAGFWGIVQDYRVTAFSAVPTVYSTLPPLPVDVDVSSVRYGIVGAAPLPDRVRTNFEQSTGIPMIEGYGLTEGTCASVIAPLAGTRVDRLGLRLPYQQIKAVRIDADGERYVNCRPGETGVLAIAGPNVFPGYLRHEDEVRYPDPSGTVDDGWLITGDLGAVDEDGFVTLIGRSKDVIIRGGHNIDPRPIEAVLLQHDDVTGAAVVARPDAHSGEVPAAYVTVREGADSTEEELMRWLQSRCPEPASAPKFVHKISALPMTAVGKVNKAALVRDCILRVARTELGRFGDEALVDIGDEEGSAGTVRIRLPAGTSRELAGDLRDRMNRYPVTVHVTTDEVGS
ncbi:acyl-CoA synthetase [Mycolicibacterium nivoides]|uniref:acyl-CoA synthetase n=1 Tax=Mycolicibacterium nivoides TaxID=2487344 RepID=UPI000F5BF0D1|nr:acyl-CoA synthetase [Mycolicibacterium nivoides]QRY45176.1 acyl-CoA synthetase [Mycolicibacterium boenickei]